MAKPIQRFVWIFYLLYLACVAASSDFEAISGFLQKHLPNISVTQIDNKLAFMQTLYHFRKINT